MIHSAIKMFQRGATQRELEDHSSETTLDQVDAASPLEKFESEVLGFLQFMEAVQQIQIHKDGKVLPPFLEVTLPSISEERILFLPVLDLHDPLNRERFPVTCQLLARARPFFPYMCCQPFQILPNCQERRPQGRRVMSVHLFHYRYLFHLSSAPPSPYSHSSLSPNHPKVVRSGETFALQKNELLFDVNGNLIMKNNLGGNFDILSLLYSGTAAAKCGLILLPRQDQILLRYNILIAHSSIHCKQKRSSTAMEHREYEEEIENMDSSPSVATTLCLDEEEDVEKKYENLVFAIKLELPQFSFSNRGEENVVSDVLVHNGNRRIQQAVRYKSLVGDNAELKRMYCRYFRPRVICRTSDPFIRSLESQVVSIVTELELIRPCHPFPSSSGFSETSGTVSLEVDGTQSLPPSPPPPSPIIPVQDLFECLDSGLLDKLDRKTLYIICIRTVLPVVFLHSAGWAHNDISLENYLIRFCHDGSVQVKLFDFGGATKTGTTMDSSLPFMGKAGYQAFEYLCNQPTQTSGAHYDRRKADVFSLGVLFHFLLLGCNIMVQQRTDDRGRTAYQVLYQEGWNAFIQFLVRFRIVCPKRVQNHFCILKVVSGTLSHNLLIRMSSEQLLGYLLLFYESGAWDVPSESTLPFETQHCSCRYCKPSS